MGELVAEGLSNKEIARRLHMGTSTVVSHVKGLARAIGLDGKADWPGAVRVQIAKWWWTGQKIEAPAAQRLEKNLYCDFCGDTRHVLVRDEGLDEVWRCTECGGERWFRVR